MNIRLMRGQCVVRELQPPASERIWTPDPSARDTHTHCGLVLGLGPPCFLDGHPDSPLVEWGFEVGAVVQFHFGVEGTQESRTRAWVDGKPATWLAQVEIDAVHE